jgi:mono/diheme cytochrome c family protein
MRSERGWRAVAGAAVLMLAITTGCGEGAGRTSSERKAAAAAVEEEIGPPIDPAIAQKLPGGITVAMVEAGRREFRSVCAPCHGPAAEGTQLGPALTGAEWIHGSGSFDDLVRTIRDGVAEPKQYPVPMPVLGGANFSEDELRAVAGYVYALRFGVR